MNSEKMMQIDKEISESNAGQFASLKTFTRVGILRPDGTITKGVSKKYASGFRPLFEGERLVTKRASFVTQTKTSYVKRAKSKDSSFEVKERAWGERISENIIKNGDNLYLETIHDPSNKLAKPKVTYYIDGVEVDKEVIEDALPKSSPSASGINVRSFKSSSIEEIKVNGKVIKA